MSLNHDIDHQRVAFPAADRIAHPGGIGIGRMRRAVVGITRNRCGYRTRSPRGRSLERFATDRHGVGSGTPVGMQVEYWPASSGPRTTLNFSLLLSMAVRGLFSPRAATPPKLNELAFKFPEIRLAVGHTGLVFGQQRRRSPPFGSSALRGSCYGHLQLSLSRRHSGPRTVNVSVVVAFGSPACCHAQSRCRPRDRWSPNSDSPSPRPASRPARAESSRRRLEIEDACRKRRGLLIRAGRSLLGLVLLVLTRQ